MSGLKSESSYRIIIQILAQLLVFKISELFDLIDLLLDISVVLKDDFNLRLFVLSKGRSGFIIYIFEVFVVNRRSLQNICKALICSLLKLFLLSFELFELIRVSSAGFFCAAYLMFIKEASERIDINSSAS